MLETENFRVNQDWETPIEGFFIVSSKKKERSVTDFSERELIEFISLVKRVREAMKRVLSIKEVYLFQNEDTEHGFHIWMFPRHQWMEKFGRNVQSVRPIMDYAEKEMCNNTNIVKVNKAIEAMKEHFR